MNEIKIGNRIIGNNHPVYIIAEIGLNHQGDIKIAQELIDAAIEAKCDAVKFQKRSLKTSYQKEVLDHTENQEQGSYYLLKHIQRSELSPDELIKLHKYCLNKNIGFLCTPWDEESLKLLAGLNLTAYKIASADMFNLQFIRKVAAQNKPLIISTGMSFISEIEQLVQFLNEINALYILLHCNSTYPAPYQDINLNFIKKLKEKFNCLVGYSGHEQGITVSLAAVALGAKVIEKHITLDKNMPGPDHRASLEPDEFVELVRQIRIVESALGENIRYPSRGEYLNREILSKSLVASKNLKRGKILTYDDIAVKSPGKGTSPLKLHLFEGKKLVKRSIKKDDYILESDIGLIQTSNHQDLKIKHYWGIVARMSDVDILLNLNPNFVEIHLTDADINTDKNYQKKYNIDLVIHGPEYSNDLLLDLSSLDNNIRNKSINYFNQAFKYGRKLKKLFKNKNDKVKYVIHPGGMNMKEPLLEKVEQLNINLLDSLHKLHTSGFELLIENMPSCPWYFGGQWYHSNFMDADEIAEFSKKTGYSIILDLSHAALYCNYYKKNLETYINKVISVTKYIHIADAARSNGEGLQIGDGTIDFETILPHLVKTDLWFLVEIWQGHKFGGEKFIEAIKKLKNIHPNF